MGIAGFHSFLKKKTPTIYKEYKLIEFEGFKIAIDTSIFLCKYKSTYGNKWLSAFLSMINKLNENGISFIFVFDNTPPIEKQREREQRSITREKNKIRLTNITEEWYQFYENLDSNLESINISDINQETHPNLYVYLNKKFKDEEEKNDIKITFILNIIAKLQKNLVPISTSDFQDLRNLFDTLQVPYIIAEEGQEAENLCVLLTKRNIVDGILTEDTDALCYGVRKFFFKPNFRNETVQMLDLDVILDELNFTYDQFRDLCILMGTDYNDRIRNIGPNRGFDLISKYSSFENFENLNLENNIDYKRIRSLFTCENFQINSEQESNLLKEISKEVSLDNIETKRYLFFNNIKILY